MVGAAHLTDALTRHAQVLGGDANGHSGSRVIQHPAHTVGQRRMHTQPLHPRRWEPPAHRAAGGFGGGRLPPPRALHELQAGLRVGGRTGSLLGAVALPVPPILLALTGQFGGQFGGAFGSRQLTGGLTLGCGKGTLLLSDGLAVGGETGPFLGREVSGPLVFAFEPGPFFSRAGFAFRERFTGCVPALQHLVAREPLIAHSNSSRVVTAASLIPRQGLSAT